MGRDTFERIHCVRLQQQAIRLYIFEYLLIIMVNARWLTTYLERLNRESTHIYGLLITPRKRGAESAELTSI